MYVCVLHIKKDIWDYPVEESYCLHFKTDIRYVSDKEITHYPKPRFAFRVQIGEKR